MASLRVFVSSTYYDLRHVRNDLYLFIKGMGYDPVMHDKGGVSYTQDTTIEQSCYNELSTCDIVVCIIGNKFGSKAASGDFSITMEELQTAIQQKKKVYTYIVKDVLIENQTYEKNIKTGSFLPAFADDVRIHEFVSEMKRTVKNNFIMPFETVNDIIDNLKMQLSGLFQHLLMLESSATESKTFNDLVLVSSKIKELMDSLSKQENDFYGKFESTIFTDNQILKRIRNFVGLGKAMFFASDRDAIIDFLKVIGFSNIILQKEAKVITLEKTFNGKIYTITLNDELFGPNGKIRDIRDSTQLEKLLICDVRESVDTEDDLPF
jgi:nucleoside 2-deoxyribosyltransferase